MLAGLKHTFSSSALDTCWNRALLAAAVVLGMTNSASAQTQTFTNNSSIAIPGIGSGPGPGGLYPSDILVSGVVGPVAKVTVTLHDLSHTWPGDIDILLVGPGGQTCLLATDPDGGTNIVNGTFVFDDNGPPIAGTPTPWIPGTYRPTANFDNLGDNVFEAPAPAGPYGLLLNVFNGLSGANVNGAWSLYIRDDTSLDMGMLATGWSIALSQPNVVTNTADSGPGSLREAILYTTLTPGPHLISFNIPTVDPGYDAINGIWRIQPTSALPPIRRTTTIDGLTQTGSSHDVWPPTLTIVLDGSNAGANVSGLVLSQGANASIIRGLVIQNFSDSGIHIAGRDDCKVQCNFIGTDHTGIVAAGNLVHGVFVSRLSGLEARRTIIGVDGDGVDDDRERNLISGNSGAGGVVGGVRLQGSIDTRIAGNYIGTNAAGNAAIPNARSGVRLSSNGLRTVIGTNGDGVSDELEGNLISGNGDGANASGVMIEDCDEVIVAGNLIGVAVNGLTALSNTGSGVRMSFASNNRIGTNADGVSDDLEKNVLSGNTFDGVLCSGTVLTGNIVAGNCIGVGSDGATPVPNRNGVRFSQVSTDFTESNTNNFIGFNLPGADDPIKGNIIAHNHEAGVVMEDFGDLADPKGIWVRGNSIHSNGDLGIDLFDDGPDVNDVGDADTGPNEFMNYPVITSIIGSVIKGSLNSTPTVRTYDIDVYQSDSPDSSGFGEGQYYLCLLYTSDAADE